MADSLIDVKLVLDRDRGMPNGAQMEALFGIAARYTDVREVRAGVGGLGLSGNYVGFTLWGDYEDGSMSNRKHVISGGIDKEGAIST